MARIYLSPPHLSGRERELLIEAVDSNWIAPLGPQVDAFEAEMTAVTEVPHALALSSGTAALHLALVVLGVGAGDEVACAGFTFAASANAITYTGATPFFVDADAATWTIDLDLLDRAIVERRQAGGRVRAVVAVDLYGQCCDYDPLRELCDRHGVALVQDAAESLGSTYRGAPAGGSGRTRGVLLQREQDHHDERRRDARLGERRLGRACAQALDAGARARRRTTSMPRSASTTGSATCSRRSAARSSRRSPTASRSRRRIRDRYRELLDVPGIAFMPEAAYGTTNAWLTCVVVDPDAFGADRERIRLALEAEDIEARPLWKPMHLQPAVRAARVLRRRRLGAGSSSAGSASRAAPRSPRTTRTAIVRDRSSRSRD